MNAGGEIIAERETMPCHWRWALIVLSTLILCSCRAPITSAPPALPQEALAGEAQYSQPEPLPYAPVGPWSPPGIAQPWPQDEYLVDGGDRGLPAEVDKDWRINGLESEDTIAHFDTLDGRTLVEPSNRVPIYAPRFCSVRQVVGLVQGEQVAGPGGVEQPVLPARQDDLAIAASSQQNVTAIRQNSAQPPIIYRGKVGDGAVSGVQLLGAYQDAFLPYENLKILREGEVDQKESAKLAAGMAAAIVWSDTQSVQIILDHRSASVAVTDRKAIDIWTVDEPPACPRLRVIKVASTQVAEPGDLIDFTIRFDNVGNQPIGNVTIVDNLSGRLEFVPGSAQSSRVAEFRTESNEVGSEVLRWEIKDPLPVGEGGVVRFQCRVR